MPDHEEEMMALTIDLEKLLRAELERLVAEAVDEAVETAKSTVESNLRKHTAKLVLRCFSEFNMERYGSDLRISVRLPDSR
jgi:hypothetical protein